MRGVVQFLLRHSLVDRATSAEGLAVRDVPSVAASDLRADAIRREGEGGLATLFHNLAPREAARSVRQVLAFAHVLNLAGRRAEDVQLLVVPGHRGMCPGLVFLPISHARL